MTVILIRHGKTAGNLEGRYIGRTDEPLCPQGAAQLNARAYPAAGRVFCSPMRRCRETAALLYPNQTAVLVPGLEECDFGDFEGKNYAELNGSPDYQRWLDSNGTLPFPGGESHERFCARCAGAFRKALAGCPSDGSAAFVVHGGTIMAVMEQFALPRGGFYDFQVKNGGGYITGFDGQNLTVREVLP